MGNRMAFWIDQELAIELIRTYHTEGNVVKATKKLRASTGRMTLPLSVCKRLVDKLVASDFNLPSYQTTPPQVVIWLEG
jgi:hypothetical protein